MQCFKIMRYPDRYYLHTLITSRYNYLDLHFALKNNIGTVIVYSYSTKSVRHIYCITDFVLVARIKLLIMKQILSHITLISGYHG